MFSYYFATNLCVADFAFISPIKYHFADSTKPGDYFFAYFDNEIQENTLYQTNLYITQSMKTTPNLTSQELFFFSGNQYDNGIS